MYSHQAVASTLSSQSETRLAVADILSTMAGESPCTFAALEGFSTGVLTQTTPTLTPTTLRSIEQTFIELQNVPPPHQVPHQNEAGFVPPVVRNAPVASASTAAHSSTSSIPISSFQTFAVKNPATSDSISCGTTPSSLTWNSSGRGVQAVSRTSAGTQKQSAGRNMGGRRPAKYEKLTPEEEERRRVRRERNKLAAARCRKRRMDHTNNLICETDGLEEQRSSLQSEIHDLQNQREELEFILEAHKVVCKLQKRDHEQVDVKPSLSELNLAMATSAGRVDSAPKTSLQRPNSLPLPSTFAIPNPPTMVATSLSSKLSLTEATGIVISTPSNGIFNFEALMEGGTGLTPVTTCSLVPVIPTCSVQQRSSSSDLSSPDTVTPPKLVSL